MKRDYKRTSSVTEMLHSLDLDLLEDRRKAHRLNIFNLAVNNSIALPIPNYFPPKQHFTRSFSSDSFIQGNCNDHYYFYFLSKDNKGLELSTKWYSSLFKNTT